MHKPRVVSYTHLDVYKRQVLHSLEGLLPAIRFHLEDSHLSKDSVLSEEEVQQTMQENEGFIPLDYIFERNFKQPLQQRNPEFYEKISGMQLSLIHI